MSQQEGFAVARKRVQTLKRALDLAAIYPKQRLSRPGATATKSPY